MERLEIARRYLISVAAADPEAVSGLVLENGVLDEGERHTLAGHVQRPAEPERDRVRWIFHFRGDGIAHLGNSKIVDIPEP